MSKVVVVPVTGSQNLSAINDNFQTIADALNDQVLFRDNPSGEPNQVVTDVDMNNKRIYNLPPPISPSEPVRYQDLGDVTALTEIAKEYAEAAEASAQQATDASNASIAASIAAGVARDAAEQSLADSLVAQEASEDAAALAQSYAASINPTFLRDRANHTGTQDISSTTTGTLPINRGGTGSTTASGAFDAVKQPATETYTGTSRFSTAAENAAGTLSGVSVDPLGIREALNCTGTAPVFGVRAWVNFNGVGTPVIRAQGNVLSVSRNGVGDYTVLYLVAMPDANYAAVISAGFGSGAATAQRVASIRDMLAGSLRFLVTSANASVEDVLYQTVTVVR